MTALPESDAATSFVLIAPLVNKRRIASATAPPSMMAPSTMLSGGTGSEPNAATLNPLPAGLSSTALTALEPISRPTRDFALRNTGYVQSCDRPNWLLENQLPPRNRGCDGVVRVTPIHESQLVWLIYRHLRRQARCHGRASDQNRQKRAILICSGSS